MSFDPNSPRVCRLVEIARRVSPVPVRMLQDVVRLGDAGPLRRGARVEVPRDLAAELLARGLAESASP